MKELIWLETNTTVYKAMIWEFSFYTDSAGIDPILIVCVNVI